jgi:xanthine dehydrogenase iron-sulfur cluster and FAD-binding subunit A
VAERTFVAHTDIPFGGVLAYSRGQTVTEQAVTDNDWQDYVHATGTKAAAEVQAEITGRDVSEFQTTSTRSAAKSTSSDSATATEQKG